MPVGISHKGMPINYGLKYWQLSRSIDDDQWAMNSQYLKPKLNYRAISCGQSRCDVIICIYVRNEDIMLGSDTWLINSLSSLLLLPPPCPWLIKALTVVIPGCLSWNVYLNPVKTALRNSSSRRRIEMNVCLLDNKYKSIQVYNNYNSTFNRLKKHEAACWIEKLIPWRIPVTQIQPHRNDSLLKSSLLIVPNECIAN